MTPIHYVGEMTLDRWFSVWAEIGGRVLCNGRDITNECRWFDQGSGQAECLDLDVDGCPSVNDADDVKTKMVLGEIQVMVP